MNDQPEFAAPHFGDHTHKPTEPGENPTLDLVRMLSSGRLKRMRPANRRFHASAARVYRPERRAPARLDQEVDEMLRRTQERDRGQWRPTEEMFQHPKGREMNPFA